MWTNYENGRQIRQADVKSIESIIARVRERRRCFTVKNVNLIESPRRKQRIHDIFTPAGIITTNICLSDMLNYLSGSSRVHLGIPRKTL